MAAPSDLLGERVHALAYDLVRAVLRPLIASRVMIRADGLGFVPPAGPALLVSNHRSILDPFVIGAIVPRHVHFVAVPGLRALLEAMGILILSGRERSDHLAALGARHFAAGAMLGIFPEGASPTLGPPLDGRVGTFHHGVARLILGAGVPDLPVIPTAVVPAGERVAVRIPGALLRRFDPADALYWRPYLDLMAYDDLTIL